MNIDISQIEVNKNIFIGATLTNTGIVKQNIYLPFQPDVMIVRNIFYAPAGAETTNTVRDIRCNLAGNDFIGSFLIIPFVNTAPLLVATAGAIGLSPTMWKITSPVQGEINFTIMNRAIPSTDLALGRISIYLDFIKFKTMQPQKIY